MTLKICFVSYLLSQRATGLSSYLRAMVEKLLDEGHHVTVLATDLEYGGKALEKHVELDRRAEIHLFSVEGALNRRLYRCPDLVAWLTQHAREFDLLDVQGIWALVNVDACRAAHRMGLPYVVTPHGMLTTWDWEKRKFVKNLLYALYFRAMLKGAAALRFLSQGELDATATPLETPVEIIPNAVEPHKQDTPVAIITELRSRLGLLPSDVLIIFLGRISRQKGVIELVQAMALLPAGSTLHLAVLGPEDQEPSYAAEVRATAASGFASNRIHMVGPIFGEEKYTYLRAADMFATISRNEGLSLAALEALAEGLPLVITRAANLPEVATYDAGRIVAAEPAGVARAFAELTADPARLAQHKLQARRLYQEHFSWQVVLPQVQRLYRNVASQRRE